MYLIWNTEIIKKPEFIWLNSQGFLSPPPHLRTSLSRSFKTKLDLYNKKQFNNSNLLYASKKSYVSLLVLTSSLSLTVQHNFYWLIFSNGCCVLKCYSKEVIASCFYSISGENKLKCNESHKWWRLQKHSEEIFVLTGYMLSKLWNKSKMNNAFCFISAK